MLTDSEIRRKLKHLDRIVYDCFWFYPLASEHYGQVRQKYRRMTESRGWGWW